MGGYAKKVFERKSCGNEWGWNHESQMLRGRMGTETISDGDGWGWIGLQLVR